jgi:hypothetical protein
MAKYDEYSQIDHSDDFGSGWDEDFSQLQEDYDASSPADGDYVVVKDEFSQVADRRRSNQQTSPKEELARVLKEIAKGEPSTRQKSNSSAHVSKETPKLVVGKEALSSEVNKSPVVKEDQLSLQLQSEPKPSSLDDDPFGLAEIGLIDVSKLRAVDHESLGNERSEESVGAVKADAAPVAQEPAADAAGVGTADATPVAQEPAADAAGVGTADVAPVAQEPVADAAGVGTADVAPVAQEPIADAAGVGTADATPVAQEPAADAAGVGTADVAPVAQEPIADAAGVGTVDAAPVEQDSAADVAGEGASEPPVTQPIKRKRKVRKQPNNEKRRYDRDARRLRLDKIKDCVLTHFAEKQFCLQDIKDILKSDIEQWEKNGVLGFDTELSVCVKGMGVEVIGQVQRMNGKRGRPSNIMVLTGKAE